MAANERLFREHLERRLREEIDAIEAKVRQLRTEQEVLKRQLAKALALPTSVQTPMRKNSVDRHLFEHTVLSVLGKSEAPAKTQHLYHACLQVLPGLLPATFRTTLHRMKEKGLITSAGRGRWAKQ